MAPASAFRQPALLRAIAGAVLALSLAAVHAQPPPLDPIRPQPGAWHVSIGTDIQVRFGTAVDPTSVERAWTIEPATPGSFVWAADGRLVTFYPSDVLLPSKRYTLRVGTGARTADGQPLVSEPYLWQFTTTGTVQTGVQIDGGRRMFVAHRDLGPELPAYLNYRYAQLSAALHPIDRSGFTSAYAQARGSERPIPTSGLPTTARWSVTVSPARAAVALPTGTPNGLYVLSLTHPSLGSDSVLVAVTDFGIVAKRGTYRSAVSVSRLMGGRPASGAAVEVLDATGNPIAAATANSDGWAELELPPATVLVAARVAGQTTVLAFGLEFNNPSPVEIPGSAPTLGHLHTDRPLYKPGDRLHSKATFMTAVESGLAPVNAGTPITLTVRDSRHTVVSTVSALADDFGSAAFDVALSDAAPVGAWSLTAAIAGASTTTLVRVEDYVKPHYEVALALPPYAVVGDRAPVTVTSRYYSGEPLVGGNVTLAVYGSGQTSVASATATTDAAGQAVIDLPDGPRVPRGALRLVAEVVDPARRPVSSEAALVLHPAALDINIDAPRLRFDSTEPISATLRVSRHDGQPVLAQRVDYRITAAGAGTVITGSLTTDPAGVAELSHALPGGAYQLTATAADAAGRTVTAHKNLWVYSLTEPEPATELSITADQAAYAPGDSVHLTVASPYPGLALVTVEGSDVLFETVVELPGPVQVSLPATSDFAPHVTAHVIQWAQRAASAPVAHHTATVLAVAADHQRLRVDVSSDESEYRPSSSARIHLKVVDHAGVPALSQLSLVLVDAGILALARTDTGDVHSAFWGRRSGTVETFDSVGVISGQVPGPPGHATPAPSPTLGAGPPTAEPTGGPQTPTPAAMATPPPPGAGPGPVAPVRHVFMDTAFWKADIQTNADGEASVDVPLPDNLTTWVAIARAVDRSGRAGQSTAEVRVSLPIVVAPALPRFAIQGDQFVVDLVARNLIGGELHGECALASPALVQLDPGVRPVVLPFGENHVSRWTVVAAQAGIHPVTATLGTGSGGDTVVVPLEVQPFTVPERATTSGAVSGRRVLTLTVPHNAEPSTSAATLRLAPSLAMGLIDGVESLVQFPYGCVEQTMSRLFPSAVVARLETELDILLPAGSADLEAVLAAGLLRLSGFQAQGGGWGWWAGNPDVYITSYVLHGLLTIRQAGFEVEEVMLARGLTALRDALRQEPDTRLRAYGAHVLALARQGDAALNASLSGDADSLDAFALAGLALATAWTDQPDESGQLLDRLEAAARAGDEGVYWSAGPRDSAYARRSMASDVKSTAFAISALAQLRPDSPHLSPAVHWLMQQRRGAGWESTQATSFAILAITDYLVATGATWREFDWSVSLDGNEVAHGRVIPGETPDPVPPISLGPDSLSPGAHTFTLNVEDGGVLHYTLITDWRLFTEAGPVSADSGGGLTLARSVSGLNGAGSADVLEVGDIVNIRLTLQTAEDLSHVLIEDRLPAGLEPLNPALDPVPVDGRSYKWTGYERREIRGDRVTFFASRLTRGRHTFDYPARAVTPGRFHTPPAEAYPMYRPDVWARAAASSLTVAPHALAPRAPLLADHDNNCLVEDFDADITAADWGRFTSRDVTGDRRVDLADIGFALAQRGAACGSPRPSLALPEPALAVEVRIPANPPQGEPVAVEIVATEHASLAGLELTVQFDAARLLLLEWPVFPEGTRPLGPSLHAGQLRAGAYTLGETLVVPGDVLARIHLQSTVGGDIGVTLRSGQALAAGGGVHPLSTGRGVLPVKSRGPTAFLPTATVTRLFSTRP